MAEKVPLPRRYTFLFVRIEIVNTSPKSKVKFSNMACRAVSAIGLDHTIDLYGYKDPLLQSLDYISIFALRDSMRTGLEAGPRHDRRLWTGDLNSQH